MRPGVRTVTRRTRSAIAILLVGLGAVSCGRSRAGSSGRHTGTGSLPAVLDRAESLAEDVQDDILGGDWAAASSKVAMLDSQADSIAVLVPAVGAAKWAADVAALRARIARRDRLRGLEAANALSRVVADASSSYDTRVPAAVSYMDIAGRSVVYAAESGAWSTAASAAAELRSSYDSVRGFVRRRGGALDGQVAAELDRIDRAIDARDAAVASHASSAVLEDVDRIERLY